MRKTKRTRAKAAAVAVIMLLSVSAVTFLPSQAAQLNDQGTNFVAGDNYPAALQNGSFEAGPSDSTNTYYDPVANTTKTYASYYTAATSNIIPQEVVPGWSTIEADQKIEVWGSGFIPGVPGGTTYNAQSGGWFAEINANDPSPLSALYQDLATTPGGLYQWSFWHAGRTGVDTAMLLLGPQGALSTSNAQAAQTGYWGGPGSAYAGAAFTGTTGPKYLTAKKNSWVEHMGYYTVPSGQTVTRYELYSYDSAFTNKAVGNLIDNANWLTIALPTTQTVPPSDTVPATSTLVDKLADGYTATPDFTDLPTDWTSTPGTYTVPVVITDGGGNITGTVKSTVIVLPGANTVTVNYVDTQGTVLGAPTVSTPTGNTYDVTPAPGAEMTFNGKVYIYQNADPADDPTSGTMNGENKNVTLIFAPKGQTLTTQYELQDGTIIGTPDVTNHNNGDSYSVTTPAAGADVTINGVTYTYVSLAADSDPATGTMNSDKTVTMILAPKSQSLTVNYQLADGTVLKTTTDSTTYDNGDGYSVPVPNAGDDVTINGKVYTYVSLAADSDPAAGTMNGDKTVNLVVAPKPQTLTTNYVLADGTVLQTTADNTTYANGDPYTVTPPAVGADVTIDGKVYTYVEVYSTSDPVTGTMNSDKTVSLVVAPKAQTVTVTYKDKDGNTIGTPDVTDYNNGDSYTVPQPGAEVTIGGKVYTYVETTSDSDPLTGTMNSDKHITFVLQLKGQSLTVQYQLADGTPIGTPTSTAYDNGDSYSVTTPAVGADVTINGVTYTYVNVSTDTDPATGTMDSDKTVTLILAPKPQTLTFQYKLADGTPIGTPNVDSTTYMNGDGYSIPVPANGADVTVGGKVYTFVQVASDSDSPAGTMNSDKTVTFVLAPKGQTVTVNYEMADGTPIGTPDVTNYKNGDSYTVPQPGAEVTINGKVYTYVNTTSDSDPLTGTMNSDKHVTFVLAPKIQTVTVTFKDKDGNVIGTPDVTNVGNGDSYTVPHPGDEVTINGKVYVYVETTSDSDSLTGTADTNKNVTFILQPKVQIVTVRYIDENGNAIGTPAVTNYDNGDSYTVPQPGQKITINGKTYEYVAVTDGSDPLSGTMNSDKQITFVLRLVDVPEDSSNPSSDVSSDDTSSATSQDTSSDNTSTSARDDQSSAQAPSYDTPLVSPLVKTGDSTIPFIAGGAVMLLGLGAALILRKRKSDEQ